MEKNRLILMIIFFLIFQFCYSQDSLKIDDVVNGKRYELFMVKTIALEYSGVFYKIEMKELGFGRYIAEVKLFRHYGRKELLDTKYIYDHYNKMSFIMEGGILHFYVDNKVELEMNLK